MISFRVYGVNEVFLWFQTDGGKEYSLFDKDNIL